MKQLILSTIVFAFGLFMFVYAKWPDKYVHFVACDVGQGDATLIYQGFFQVLIDSSRDERVLRCLDRFLPIWDRHIEVVVTTHYDADHVGGLQSVLRMYDVGMIITPTDAKDTELFDDTLTSIIDEVEQGTIFKEPIFGDFIRSASGIEFFMISPWFEKPGVDQDSVSLHKDVGASKLGKKSTVAYGKEQVTTETLLSAYYSKKESLITSTNNRSIVLLFRYKDISMLLTGDIEKQSEQALLTHELITQVNLLKVGHHGAKTSTSDVFLTQLQPEISVISSGKNNQFDHPSQSTLDKLAKIGSLTLRTDEQGDIELTTDGEKIWIVE